MKSVIHVSLLYKKNFILFFSSIIFDHFIRIFMRGPITDINQKFILPSLSFNQQDVDYIGPDFRQLVMSLTHSSTQLQPNTNLFYSLLMLEPCFEPYSFGKLFDLCYVQDRREEKAT